MFVVFTTKVDLQKNFLNTKHCCHLLRHICIAFLYLKDESHENTSRFFFAQINWLLFLGRLIFLTVCQYLHEMKHMSLANSAVTIFIYNLFVIPIIVIGDSLLQYRAVLF